MRALKPDVVVIAIPLDAKVESEEEFIHCYSWIMNWSLSFGHQEWDCVVVHWSVAALETIGSRDDLVHRLVRAQHLDLIDRIPNDSSSAAKLFSDWFTERADD